jgi:enoyl-CoA hydratase/carnithine racemase
MTDKMRADRQGRVGIMTFNNPEKHNAVSFEMWEAAERILDSFENDPEVRVVVLTGAGGKAFVSGADISKFDSERASEEAVQRYNAMVEKVYGRIYRFPKPTIAMIRGYCLGGGLNLAICCDMRYAKLGLGYGYPGLRRYIETIGPVATKEIFFTARQLSAAEALRWNMVNAVVADDALETTVMGVADTIAGNAPLTIATIKRSTVEILRNQADQDIAACDAMVAACFASDDYREGRKAFLEKRKPAFTGT